MSLRPSAAPDCENILKAVLREWQLASDAMATVTRPGEVPAYRDRARHRLEVLMHELELLSNLSPEAASDPAPKINFEVYSPEEVISECRLLRDVSLRALPSLTAQQREKVWLFFDEEITSLTHAALAFSKQSRPHRDSPNSVHARKDTFQRLSSADEAIADSYSLPEQPDKRRTPLPQERTALLAEASKTLFDSIEYEATLTKLARLALRSVCDWCIVDAMTENGEYERFTVLHRDPTKEALARELRDDYCPGDGSRGVPSQVLRTGKTLLIPEVTEKHYAATARSPRHEEVLRALGSSSYMCVPLMARDRFLGAITLVTSEPEKKYSPEDVRFAEELCSRAALALDNALLHQKSQKAIRLREDMMAIVSHDLKNPLTAISMSANLVARFGAQPAKRYVIEKASEAIRSSVRRMESLIADLLDLSRLEAGQFELDRGAHSVTSILHEARELFEPIAASQSVDLIIDSEADFIIRCDRERILQVLSNLIGNALKFTPPLGTITVSARGLADYAQIQVEDTGSGISAQDMPHLFDRFWQVRKADRKGSGLGLSIVKAMVEAHGGSVGVRSVIGSGSCFEFTLPLRVSEAGLEGDMNAS